MENEDSVIIGGAVYLGPEGLSLDNFCKIGPLLKTVL
jgi:hypothetical protein